MGGLTVERGVRARHSGGNARINRLTNARREIDLRDAAAAAAAAVVVVRWGWGGGVGGGGGGMLAQDDRYKGGVNKQGGVLWGG